MADPPGPGAHPGIADLVAELAADAGPAEAGQFTLERGRARELLAARRLADPTQWILLAVQAAVLRGATRLTATITTRAVDLAFDGAPFTPAELDRLYDEAVAPELATTDAARARRKLALALSSARALDWSEVAVDSGDGVQATRLSAWPPDRERIEPAPGQCAGTRVRVVRALPPDPEPGELVALRRRCRHAPLDLVANDETIAPEATFSPGAPSWAIERPGFHGTAGFAPRFDAPSVLRLVQHGVILAERLFPERITHLVAVVEAPDQRTDLTDLALVSDDAHQELRDAVIVLHDRERPGVDLPGLEQRWLEAEARTILSNLAPGCRARRRWGLVIDVLLFMGLLQLLVLPIGVGLSNGPKGWSFLATLEALALLGALGTAWRGPLVLAPHPRDPVGRQLAARLLGHPRLRSTTERLARATRSPVSAWFESSRDRGILER
jgi:hypothetical protein